MKIKVGSRYLMRFGWSGIVEIKIKEISPSGDFFKAEERWYRLCDYTILEELKNGD